MDYFQPVVVLALKCQLALCLDLMEKDYLLREVA
jgi:hypothetical protein